MAKRVRIIQWIVKPVVVTDDGENLSVLVTQEQAIPAALWDDFKTSGDKVLLEALEAEVNQ